jgi:drug/metabolite transporter (DMT)-like permease
VSAINIVSRPRAWVGITIALAAAAGFALANTAANLAYQGGSNPLTVAATRFLAPTAALVVWLQISDVSLLLPRRDTIAAAVLGIVTALYSWALLRSFSSIPFALAVLIFYLFPLLAAVIVAGLGWERLAWKTGAAIVVALAGLALALNVRGGSLDIAGMALAFSAAVGLAIVVVISSRVFGKGDARPLTLYMAAAASVVLLILCAASGDLALPRTAFYGFAMIAFFIAVSIIGPVRTSLLSYADAVISATLGVILLGQALTLAQIAGIAIVILALIGATLPSRS